MTELMTIGMLAPDFSLQNDLGSETTLSLLRGKWVVLYFYPKDNTSGCTTEALEFSALAPEFEGKGALILAVSPDSIKSHCKFREAHTLKVTLLSDPESSVLQAYGAWKMKSLYGRQYMGVERTTLLISPDGRIAQHWAKVKASGHAATVLAKLTELAA